MRPRSILFLFILLWQLNAFAKVVDKPKTDKLVNDFGNILSPSEEQLLENKLVAFDDSTSTQIAIVTIPTLDGAEISSYAFELGEKWGMGRKGKNNGVLFLVAVKDRKMFIAPGYGLEGAVTDLACKRIVESYLKPNFRAGNYYKGLDEGTDVVMGLATGEFKADEVKKRKHRRGEVEVGWEEMVGMIILGIIFILILLNRYADYKNSNISSRSRGFWAAMFIATTMGGQGTSWGSFNSGSGGFGGGGGFGGFGGGSFGGGGAGGSW